MSDRLRAGVRVEGGRLGRLGVVLIAAGALVMVGAVQGCGDDDDDNGPVAGSSGKSGSGGAGGSAGAGGGAGTGGGAGAGGGAGQGGSAGNGGGSAVPQPTKLAFSATAQDRLLGVTYDKSGNLYATGVVADAAGDLSTLVTKIKADGTLDAAFGVNGVASTNVSVGKGGEVMRGVVVQSTGKIVVAGIVEAKGATDERDRDIALVRFDATGKIDESFGEGGVVTFSLSDGAKVGEKNYVADSQWGLSVYGDDKLLVVCSKKADGVDRTDSDFAVVRRLADGSPDDGFGTGGVLTLPDDKRSVSVRTSTILPDGSAVVAGYTSELVGEVVSPVVFKIGADGKLDSGFGTGGVFNEIVLPAVTEAYAAVLQGDKLVTAGYGRAAPTEKLDAVSLRLTSAGVLDPTWGTGGVVRVDVAGLDDRARSLSVLPDGRVALVGGAQQVADNADAMVTVLNAAGQPDATFAPNGRMIYDLGGTNDFFWGSAVSPDGKTLAAIGYSNSADATLDDAFVLLVPLTQ